MNKTANSAIESAFSALSRVRHGRALHTRGLVCRGQCTIEDKTLPLRSGEAVVRISKGLGLPGGLPDIVGVATRIPTGTETQPVESPCWDLLMSGPLLKFGPVPVPRPTLSWNGVQVSTGTGFRYDDRVWRISARLLIPGAIDGLSLNSLRESLTVAGGLSLQTTSDNASHAPLGFIELDVAEPDTGVKFDPVGSVPAGVEPVPGQLTELRRSACRGSRRGRDQL